MSTFWKKDTIRKIQNEDPRRIILMQRPRIIYNLMTGSSFIHLDINNEKTYVLCNDVVHNERTILKKDILDYTSEHFTY